MSGSIQLGEDNIGLAKQGTPAVEYTDIDQNAAATTTLYAPSGDAHVSHIHLNNPGTSAELRLEVTDGSSTAILADPGAGSAIDFAGSYYLAGGTDELQVVVETAEGVVQTATAAVGRREF